MKILIVEDEIKLAESLAMGLKLKGYVTDILTDGKEALSRITNFNKEYDLIILDLMLPSMDGEEICKKLRSLNITVPILILTARNEVEIKVRLLLCGADDYLVKPFSFEELLARIKALLRRPTEMTPTILEFAGIRLDTGLHTVNRDENDIPLTIKEFHLLEYFMHRPNQVISREELLSHLWDFNYESFSNVIDVHVKNLRKKLCYENKSDVLETVRGLGYRLHE